MFNVNQSLLRYWDKEFPTLKLKKTRKGDRRFTKEDIGELTKIYTLVKERGFTIGGARKQLSSSKQSINPNGSITEILANLKSIRASLKDLRDKLD